MNEIRWPGRELERLRDAVDSHLREPVGADALMERCNPPDDALVEIAALCPGREPLGMLYMRGVRVAAIALRRPSPTEHWVATVELPEPVLSGGGRPTVDALPKDIRVEWAGRGALRFGSMLIDGDDGRLWLDGVRVATRLREVRCLWVLANAPGRWLTAAEIAGHLPMAVPATSVSRTLGRLEVRLTNRGHVCLDTHAARGRGHRFRPAGWPRCIDLRDGDIEIDLQQQRVWVAGVEVLLSARRFQLLCIFVDQPERGRTLQELTHELGGLGPRTVVKHVSELNRALGRPYYLVWDGERGVYTTRGSQT